MKWQKRRQLVCTSALILLANLFSLTGSGADLNWLTDLPKAQAQAKNEKKLVLINFTGSDWCGWCIKLKKEVFDTKEFTDYAAKNLVLVEVDFPRGKQLSAEQKKANEALQAKYHAEGFPTIVALTNGGREVWKQVGCMKKFNEKEDPKVWLAKLDEAKKK